MNSAKACLREIALKMSGLFIALAIFISMGYSTSGQVDESFDASAFHSINGAVAVIEPAPDGKIYIGGNFTAINGFARSGIARLNADGSVDTTFDPPDFFSSFGLGFGVLSIGIQSDGKIIVSGTIFGVNGLGSNPIKRLNPDGSLDAGFIVPMGIFSTINAVEVLPTGKILLGGDFQNISSKIVRINSDGSFDNSFLGNISNTVRDIEIQTDGKLIVGGGLSNPGFLVRLNSDGTNDASFNTGIINGNVHGVEIQSDGKILIGGAFTLVNGFQVGRVARILSNGSLDTTFNLNLIGANSTVKGLMLAPNGKIGIIGSFTSFNFVARSKVAQLNSDGTLDTSFNNPGLDNITQGFDVEILPSGKVLIGVQGIQLTALVRLNADGLIDTSISMFVGLGSKVRNIVQQPDGKIIASGAFDRGNGEERFGIARFNLDGSLDPTFVPINAGATTEIKPDVISFALQSDGKIVVGTNDIFSASRLRRLNSDGSLDTTFTQSGFLANDLAILPDGKIIVVGNEIKRLNSNGTNDTSFNPPQLNGMIRKVYVELSGKIWISGDFTQISPSIRNRIAKLNSDGTVDNSFNPLGGANNSVYDFEIQSDGKVFVGGDFTSLNGNNNIKYVGRFNADGTLDTSFVSVIEDWRVRSVKVQPNGKVLVGGETFSSVLVSADPRKGIIRINSNGTLDNTFNVGTGANKSVLDIALQSDGKILLGGEFTRINGKETLGISRLLDDSVSSPARTPFDFDGDGKSDVSVFRPSNNVWYAILSGNASVLQENFGISGDVLAPADFDGDGKTDLGIFRPSTGSWWYLSSVDNTQKSVQFGASGDIPMPSDINGDGVDDFVVFRPSNNVWYRATSNDNTVSSIAFGASGDKPLIGDFDGDGKADPAIFRPSTGDWWYQSSIDNSQNAVHWGAGTDIPIPADYDGDGTTDLAVYRPSEGGWYIFNSSTQLATTMAFGISTDIPIPADYDGDGKADIAVFRPSTGIWYLLQSTDGFTGLQFGISTDKPIPSSFLQ